MPTNEPLHLDRGRAESFGAVAADYDAYRPSYPDGLISDLVELAPARALDVACGTGKVAVALVACGIAVLGVEIDPQMAAVARSHGLIVEEGGFETWDDEGRTFDLITCGQGWHWIDPDAGNAKALRLLNPGGTLALFWNRDRFDDDLQDEFAKVYEQYAPDLAGHDRGHRDDPFVAQLRDAGFTDVETRNYKWISTVTTDQFIGRTSTYSDHLALPADTRTALFGALREVIDRRGGTVPVHFKTYTIFART